MKTSQLRAKWMLDPFTDFAFLPTNTWQLRYLIQYLSMTKEKQTFPLQKTVLEMIIDHRIPNFELFDSLTFLKSVLWSCRLVYEVRLRLGHVRIHNQRLPNWNVDPLNSQIRLRMSNQWTKWLPRINKYLPSYFLKHSQKYLFSFQFFTSVLRKVWLVAILSWF
jgi:hypothetical protein